MIYLQLLLTVLSAFLVCMLIERWLCSKKVRDWYNRYCMKALKKVPEEMQEAVLLWLKTNIIVSTESEITGREIIRQLPIEISYKLNEKKLRAYMQKLGYTPLSECCLDPDVYAVALTITKGSSNNG